MCAGYICNVCSVNARKYGIGLKLQACDATVLTVETGKRMTGLLYQRRYSNKYPPIPIPTSTGEYRPIPDTGIDLTLLRMPFAISCQRYFSLSK